MKYLGYILPISLIFIAALACAINVPMHSDDYFYYLLGTYPSNWIAHYNGWSGRFFTNIISSTMLSTFPHYVNSVINSLAIAALPALITVLAFRIADKKVQYKPFSLAYFLVFFTYWAANKSLGQTTFWIVGSANYVWPNIFISAFLIALLSFRNCNQYAKSILLLPLGVLAGCSNENTCILVILSTIIYTAFNRKDWSGYVAIFSSVVGALILLLSPGNAVRSKNYVEWNETGILHKAFYHFSERMPGMMASYWLPFALSLLCIIVIAMNGKLGKRVGFGILFFLACSVAANAVFFVSPVTPDRSLNGGLFFSLIALSICTITLFDVGIIGKITSAAAIAFSFVFFIPSYVLFYQSMEAVSRQDAIRDEIIKSAKASGAKDVVVPNYYFGKLARPGDKLDGFQSQFMPKFYKMNSTKAYPVYFDYSLISPERMTGVGKDFLGVRLKGIYAFNQGPFRGAAVLMDFDSRLEGVIPEGSKLFMHVIKKDGSTVNADPSNSTIYIKGNYYTGRIVKINDVNDIAQFKVGIYDKATGKRLVEYSVNK